MWYIIIALLIVGMVFIAASIAGTLADRRMETPPELQETGQEPTIFSK